ncbi:MAG: hypothetical protein H3C34_17545, partial [Caldilineaceae bacterium]|nr:hypothetical protein [Caldilineaceae bacterium]
PAVATERLFEHLAESYFAALPPELTALLEITAVPRFFNRALAAELHPDIDTALTAIRSRNLFLEELPDRPGWYAYHDLIRAYLLEQAQQDLAPVYGRTVDWFKRRNELEQAIEHALEGGLFVEAALLMEEVEDRILADEGRLWTFRRWLYQLPQAMWAEHVPMVCAIAGSLHNGDQHAESWNILRKMRALVKSDDLAVRRVAREEAHCYFNEGRFAQACESIEALLPGALAEELPQLLRLFGKSLNGLGRLREAAAVYRQAIAAALAVDDERTAMYLRHNLAANALIPLGRYVEARQLLDEIGPWFRQTTFLTGAHLLAWCDLHFAMGDWPALAGATDKLEDLLAGLDELFDENRLYGYWARAAVSCAQGQWQAAQDALDAAFALQVDDDLATLSLARVQAWLLRRQGQGNETRHYADTMLARLHSWPDYRAAVGLERDLAAGVEEDSLHPATCQLIPLRLRGHLVRLRALLALRCYRHGNKRWRRHVHAALAALDQPGYRLLLTSRDPELAAAFWPLLLAEGIAPARAGSALLAIGQSAPLLALLEHPQARARAEAAALLARLGDEAAIPALTAALERESDSGAQTALGAALEQLETQAPPLLAVRLMGDFSLARGGEPVADAVWPRPVVKKLFQYFALHQGEKLPRDRIVEDLWPNDDPASAAATFRKVHSWLRGVLEPYLRPKAPSRYFDVEGDVYTFDPHGRVTVDVTHFQRIVSSALAQAEQYDVPPLADDLLAMLEQWQPLLPAVPYEDWLIESREHLQNLYVEGCLYVANAAFVRGTLREAMRWAQRALDAAPWLEEAYQILMRCHARLGERTLALRVYASAQAALREELGVEVSPLTEWLVARLQDGLDI